MHNDFAVILKNLRKQRSLTQEQLAETIGISCQAVSKWETNSSYPDISLLIIIADYFDVSVDYLLGHDTSKQNEEIKNVYNQANDLFKSGNYLQAIPVLRETLIKHPGNEELMYNLAWALSGTIKESPENYDEAILLYQKILEISSNAKMKIKVTRDLIYRFSTKNEVDKALLCAKELPAFEFCREYNLGRSNLLTGKELSDYLQSNIVLFGNAILECLEYFTNERILTAEEMKPYSCSSAKEKIELIKRII